MINSMYLQYVKNDNCILFYSPCFGDIDIVTYVQVCVQTNFIDEDRRINLSLYNYPDA